MSSTSVIKASSQLIQTLEVMHKLTQSSSKSSRYQGRAKTSKVASGGIGSFGVTRPKPEEKPPSKTSNLTIQAMKEKKRVTNGRFATLTHKEQLAEARQSRRRIEEGMKSKFTTSQEYLKFFAEL